MDFQHTPVLLSEVLELLDPQPGKIVVDGTVGGAGHSFEILQRILPGGRLIGLDQDHDAVQAARTRLLPLGADNFQIIHSNFLELKDVLSDIGVTDVDGILLDLGVSSYQLDQKERGFSYQHDAPLDMRMNREQSFSAYELVNQATTAELQKIIWDYGEERWAKRIAEFIDQERREKTIETTGQLVEIIKKAIPKGARKDGPHPAKRTFQALRIAVNKELEIIEKSLENGVEVLKAGGVLAVITFHSLEDRLVKQTFRKLAQKCICPPTLPKCVCGERPKVKILTGKPILPSKEEVTVNPRSRSAKLRAVRKICLSSKAQER
ncbi:MAG: 16S rRNA (cytosine(1402)-N(4))-methyltransferase RsmH [Peptococcia bacterium]